MGILDEFLRPRRRGLASRKHAIDSAKTDHLLEPRRRLELFRVLRTPGQDLRQNASEATVE